MKYPLTREEFRHALSRGYGRAVVHLKEHPDRVYREEIEYAITHCQAYDTECEDSRAAYLLMVLHAAGDKRSYVPGLLDSLALATERRDAGLMIDLAVHFARTGLSEAREAIYEKLRLNNTDEPFQSLRDIVLLDGLAGFQQAARIAGALIGQFGSLCGRSDGLEAYEHLGLNQADARAWLERERSVSPEIGAFAEWTFRQQAHSLRREEISDIVKMNCEKILALIRADRPGTSIGPYALSRWGRSASLQDIERFARVFENEPDMTRRKRMVRAFAKRAFPGDPATLIELAKSDDKDSRHFALNALANVRHPAVRSLFFELLQTGRPRFDLLQHNHESGDDVLVASILADASTVDQWRSNVNWIHGAGLDLLELVGKGVLSNHRIVLQWVYDNSPCSLCRNSAVSRLIELGMMPDWMLSECRYDCASSTRIKATTELSRRRLCDQGCGEGG